MSVNGDGKRSTRMPDPARIAGGLGRVVVALGLVAAIACGPQENGDAAPPDTATRPNVEGGLEGAPEGDAPGTQADTALRGPGSPVEVSLTEFEIGMPGTLPAGEKVFQVTNDGTVEHSFEVEGQGVERVLDQPLQPGQTDTLRMELQPGSYRVYCPVADHEDRGMSMQLEVTRDGSGTAAMVMWVGS